MRRNKTGVFEWIVTGTVAPFVIALWIVALIVVRQSTADAAKARFEEDIS